MPDTSVVDVAKAAEVIGILVEPRYEIDVDRAPSPIRVPDDDADVAELVVGPVDTEELNSAVQKLSELEAPVDGRVSVNWEDSDFGVQQPTPETDVTVYWLLAPLKGREDVTVADKPSTKGDDEMDIDDDDDGDE